MILTNKETYQKRKDSDRYKIDHLQAVGILHLTNNTAQEYMLNP